MFIYLLAAYVTFVSISMLLYVLFIFTMSYFLEY